MELIGTIENIIYRNESNGYTVLGIYTDKGNPEMAVGQLPSLNEGQRIRFIGNFIETKKYGKQFEIKEFEILKPNSVEGIYRYLSSGLIRGVGPKTAEKIITTFGEKTLEIIEFNYERLAEINGISESKAFDIYSSYSEIKDMQTSIMALQEWGITINLAMKIYDKYKKETVETVKNNPYLLIEDIDGVGFITADKIAEKTGISLDSDFRIRAGLVYLLKETSEKDGNTFLPRNLLINENCRLLGLNQDEVFDKMLTQLNNLQIDNVVRNMQNNGDEIVMLAKYYYLEKSLALHLMELHIYASDLRLNLNDEITLFEKVNKIALHDDQKDAVKMAVNKGVSVITGGPGTGKTTIVKCILQILKDMGLKVKLLAPTGRASKRLSESTGQDASTIHRALDIDYKNGNGYFSYNENNKLDYDVIICDEVSMVDVALMNNLVKAIRKGSKFVMVGDKDQLPSVGAGNVLADLLSSKIIPVTNLTRIYRQDGGSLIVQNAHLINNGQMPIIDNTSEDFFFDYEETPIAMCDAITSLVSSRLSKHFNIESTKIQVLAPMKVGVCGVLNLNKSLQDEINPSSIKKPEVQFGETIFRQGDKIMQIVNNYNMEWRRQIDKYAFEEGLGVFNGDIGFIDEINRNTNSVQVTFDDGRQCTYLFADLAQIVLAYAITIHKSQGSEFDAVIIPLVAGSKYILTKNVIYTAVTRAKKVVVLVGDKQNLARMVKNNYTAKRNSMLATFLNETNEL